MTNEKILDSEPQETSHVSQANSYKPSSGESNLMEVNSLTQTLETTERELFDCRTQLQAKVVSTG